MLLAHYILHIMWMGRHILFVSLLFALTESNSAAVELESNLAYSFDNIPAHYYDAGAGIRLPWKGGALLGRAQFLQSEQDSFHGIKPILIQTLSGLAGFSLPLLRQHLQIEPQAGIDVVGGQLLPRWDVKVGASVTMPANPMLPALRLSLRSYRTGRSQNAAASANHIRQTGYMAGMGSALLNRLEFYAHYEMQIHEPASSVLDSFLLEPRRGGIAPDTLAPNRIEQFYAYVYSRVLSRPRISVGYAFSWSNSETDRWRATWQAVHAGIPQPPSMIPVSYLVCEYAYYPYSTPIKARSHLFLLFLDMNLPGSVMFGNKLTLPFLSTRAALASPDTVYLGASRPAYNAERNTAPLLLESKMRREWGRMSTELAYGLFCTPYRAYSYFSEDKYAFHSLECRVRLTLPGSSP